MSQIDHIDDVWIKVQDDREIYYACKQQPGSSQLIDKATAVSILKFE